MVNYSFLCSACENPPAKYRPVQIIHHYFPHTEAEIAPFLRDAAEKGMGGFVVNVGGNAEEYLDSASEWEALRRFVTAALDAGLKIWLYDEQGYPSGAAARHVIETNPDFCVQGVCAQTILLEEGGAGEAPLYGFSEEDNDGRGAETPLILSAAAYPVVGRTPELRLSMEGKVELRCENGMLRWDLPDRPYLVTAMLARKVNYRTEHDVPYVDLLNPAVTDTFLSWTHRRYLEHLGAELMGRITAIFTDEPGLAVHGCSSYFKEKYAVVPWTAGFGRMYLDRTGRSLNDDIARVFFDFDAQDKAVRRDFWLLVSDRFSDSYFRPIYDFCEKTGIASTGHLYGEENLAMQTGLNGTMFEHMTNMQMPGVDRLYCTDPVNVIPEKTAASAAHLTGHMSVMSESSSHFEYNCWHKETHTEDMINSALYQIQLGVNQTASYYGYSQDASERKRFEEVVGRASAFMFHGIHRAEFAVLIPTEAAWERYLPRPYKYWESVLTWQVECGIPADLAALEKGYNDTLVSLLDHQLDFDLVDLSFLKRKGTVRGGRLELPFERFWGLIVFDCGEPDPTTARALADLVAMGLKIYCVPVNADGHRSPFYHRQGIRRLNIEDYEGHDLHFAHAEEAVRIRHCSIEGAEVYLLHNRTGEARILELQRLPKGTCELFDLMNGTHESYGGAPLHIPAKSALALVVRDGQ